VPEAQRTPGQFVRLQGSSFGGDPAKGNAAGSGTSGQLLTKRIPLCAERLKDTTILQSDYASTIKRYDSPRTAIYLDPPYPETKKQYTNYSRRIPTVQEVKSSLTGIEGKFLLSYPDIPEVRKAFPESRFHVTRFRVYKPLTSYNPGPRTRTELLITNYNPRRDHWQPEGLQG